MIPTKSILRLIIPQITGVNSIYRFVRIDIQSPLVALLLSALKAIFLEILRLPSAIILEYYFAEPDDSGLVDM